MAGEDLFSSDGEFQTEMARYIARRLGGVAGAPAPGRGRPTGTNRLQQKLLSKSARFDRRAR